MAAAAAELEYAGYSQQVTLRWLDEPISEPPAIGLWNLIQLPVGGQMLVPLYAPATPQKCFGDLPGQSMLFEDRLLRINVDFSGSHKISLKAASLCGRAGYVYNREGRWALVVRNFTVNPSGQYVDVQSHAPEDFGYAFQMCRVDDAAYGSFCELEYHAPALGSPPLRTESEDVSQVWAFRGRPDAIDRVARKLLGAGL